MKNWILSIFLSSVLLTFGCLIGEAIIYLIEKSSHSESIFWFVVGALYTIYYKYKVID